MTLPLPAEDHHYGAQEAGAHGRLARLRPV